MLTLEKNKKQAMSYIQYYPYLLKGLKGIKIGDFPTNSIICLVKMSEKYDRINFTSQRTDGVKLE